MGANNEYTIMYYKLGPVYGFGLWIIIMVGPQNTPPHQCIPLEKKDIKLKFGYYTVVLDDFTRAYMYL